MACRIEDYALIGDCQTAALVGRDGSIDWLCLPRFDSGACFAALLGSPANGRWQLAPAAAAPTVRRRYRGDSLVLETEFETPEGVVALLDGMGPRNGHPVVVRQVEGRKGRVPMRMELIIRYDYGSIIPWVRQRDGALQALAGPNGLCLRTPAPTRGENRTTVAEFTVAAGERVPFSLSWFPSEQSPPPPVDAAQTLQTAEIWWHQWAERCQTPADYRDAVARSLITLKALTYAPTGGIVAAATTSLPEQLGGERNWDYRYCWLRDATFTLYALMGAGYREEAAAWREWLSRAAAGDPSDLQIMYGLSGERRLTEWEAPWLPGYEASQPVRIGNAAHSQFQLDVYGELLDVMFLCRRVGLPPDEDSWNLEQAILTFLESAWSQPDEGIWEVRGGRKPFTHSKVMAWVAFDRGIKMLESFGLEGPRERWRAARRQIHDEVCRAGFNTTLGSFVQYYGSDRLDASLLMIPLVGFLPPEDPRVRGTVAAIQRGLMHDGLVARYDASHAVDGLPPGEGMFLPCTFWLADNLVLQGRAEEAREIFERLLALRNDVGLLSEEYDPKAGRLVGNFPQAFSHVGLVNTAHNLGKAQGPAAHRGQS